MNKFFLTAAALAVFATAPAIAQGTGPMVVAPQSADKVLRTGTPIVLSLSEELTTKGKTLRTGYRFRMEVAEPVKVNGVVVIPAGSPAIGEITDVRNKGMWGKSGKINARLLSVTVNGRSIRISGQFDDKGVTGTAGVVGAVAFVPVAGFFFTGTSANVPRGTTISGFIDEDVPLVMPTTPVQSQPLPVYSQPVIPQPEPTAVQQVVRTPQNQVQVDTAPVQTGPQVAPTPDEKPRRSRVIINGQSH